MDINLFNAILSMDAYNRGYGASIALPTVVDTTKLGNVTISATSSSLVDENGNPNIDDDIGFYAVAYNVQGAGTIIAYRGTDNLNPDPDNPLHLPDDIYHGWTLGAGNIDSEQGQMAIRFYQAVTDIVAGDWLSAQISLTGHSLGGGLAGLVGGLYDQDALLFDSMEYNPGLLAYDRATSNPAEATYQADIKNLVYGASAPWAQDTVGISATHVEGEALGFVQLTASTMLDLGDNVTGLGAVDRHSMSTLVIRKFADVGGPGDTALDTDWRVVAQYFWPLLYDNDFAAFLGAASVLGTLERQGKYSDILRGAIAYSAIDEGERPFGDTAIRALYDDANELGGTLTASGPGSKIEVYAGQIAQAFVQYAGTLALNKVLMEQKPWVLNGVLAYGGAANDALVVDFSDATWKGVNNGVLPDMPARADLVGALYEGTGNANVIHNLTQKYWGDDTVNIIERVVFAVENGGTTTISDSAGSKGTLYIGGSDYFMLRHAANDNRKDISIFKTEKAAA